MWANHFEDLGKPSVSPCFDNEFSDRIATRVRNIFASCQNELPGTLNEPLQYQELMLKHGYYIQAHYLENSRSHRVQGREEY